MITIHKSKGLEFDLVWLPFVGNFRQQQQALYHDRHSFRALLDLDANEESRARAEGSGWRKTRLLTRGADPLGVSCCASASRRCSRLCRKQGETDLHHSALGYLVRGQAGDAAYLQGGCSNWRAAALRCRWWNRRTRRPARAALAERWRRKSFTQRIRDFGG